MLPGQSGASSSSVTSGSASGSQSHVENSEHASTTGAGKLPSNANSASTVTGSIKTGTKGVGS